jgi:hypothetical protein
VIPYNSSVVENCSSPVVLNCRIINAIGIFFKSDSIPLRGILEKYHWAVYHGLCYVSWIKDLALQREILISCNDDATHDGFYKSKCITEVIIPYARVSIWAAHHSRCDSDETTRVLKTTNSFCKGFRRLLHNSTFHIGIFRERLLKIFCSHFVNLIKNKLILFH